MSGSLRQYHLYRSKKSPAVIKVVFTAGWYDFAEQTAGEIVTSLVQFFLQKSP